MSRLDYLFAIEGLDQLGGIDDLGEGVRTAAIRAVNATATRTRARAADRMRDQVNFPASYLKGPESRLTVTEYALQSRLAATITGRQRPTSLARFVTGSRVAGQRNPTVEVKPGRRKAMGRSFLMRLRVGDTAGGNLGLAVRVPAGQMPERAYRPTKIGENLFLVYGPSVDQVFRTVRDEVAPEAAVFLENEFRRLLDLEIT